LQLFETMIGVTGIGPKLACAILSHIRTDLVCEAIQNENADFLATVPGVGKKTAARMILELRGKLPAGLGVAAGAVPAIDGVQAEVIEALRALGYTAAEAHGAVARTARGVESGAPVEERLLAALRELGQG
jgi:Holliday junction DNA helicase RuvA